MRRHQNGSKCKQCYRSDKKQMYVCECGATLRKSSRSDIARHITRTKHIDAIKKRLQQTSKFKRYRMNQASEQKSRALQESKKRARIMRNNHTLEQKENINADKKHYMHKLRERERAVWHAKYIHDEEAKTGAFAYQETPFPSPCRSGLHRRGGSDCWMVYMTKDVDDFFVEWSVVLRNEAATKWDPDERIETELKNTLKAKLNDREAWSTWFSREVDNAAEANGRYGRMAGGHSYRYNLTMMLSYATSSIRNGFLDLDNMDDIARYDARPHQWRHTWFKHIMSEWKRGEFYYKESPVEYTKRTHLESCSGCKNCSEWKQDHIDNCSGCNYCSKWAREHTRGIVTLILDGIRTEVM